MAWCLPKHLTSQFLERLKNGEISPERLSEMTSAERRSFFSEFLGEENAVNVNSGFESKLLLKNQQAGMVRWAEQMADLKPLAKRNVLDKINKMEEILTPENEAAFLEDLVGHKLGTTVSMNEASTLSSLAKEAGKKKEMMEQGGNRMDYGYSRVAFENYLNELKAKDSRSVFERGKDKLLHPGQLISEAAGLSKSAKATLDVSWIGRQGWKLIFSHPKQWGKTVVNSFKDVGRTFGGKKVMDEVMADVYSRPNYENYLKDKVDIGVIEEAFPESTPLKKIPVVGKIHEAAEVAFTAAAKRNRVDLYDLYYNIAKKSGIEDPVGQGIGKLVNSLTSRGDLGKLEPSANAINNVFFSGRKLKADIDFLTAHVFGKEVSPFVKKQAAKNLVRTVMGTATILTLADAMMPGSVEWNPKSSDFGKIKVGNSRFDVTGGVSSVITLASRVITFERKNANTGKVYAVNSGLSQGTDLFYDFFENKLSPFSQIVKNFVNREDYDKQPLTLGGIAKEAFLPLPIDTALELAEDPDSADFLVSMFFETLGVGVNTFGEKKKKVRRRR